MSGGFYVDANEQRSKARLAEQKLIEHSQNRIPRRSPVYEEDPIESSLPPVFRREGYYQTARDTSVDRRAARFRDGLPPPPPPVHPDAIPRLLPPPAPPLVDQHSFDSQDAMVPPPSAPPMIRLPEQAFDPLLDASLSPSQKKRLRRKRKKEEQRSQQPDDARRPAPMPLPIDQTYPGAVLATAQPGALSLTPAPVPSTTLPPILPLGPPSPSHPEITQTACQAEVIVRMPNGSAHRVRCPLRPFPHPNQPHMLQLQDATGQGTEIFLGFWLEGE